MNSEDPSFRKVPAETVLAINQMAARIQKDFRAELRREFDAFRKEMQGSVTDRLNNHGNRLRDVEKANISHDERIDSLRRALTWVGSLMSVILAGVTITVIIGILRAME